MPARRQKFLGGRGVYGTQSRQAAVPSNRMILKNKKTIDVKTTPMVYYLLA